MIEPTREWVEKWCDKVRHLAYEITYESSDEKTFLATIYREVWEMASTAERRRVLEEFTELYHQIGEREFLGWLRNQMYRLTEQMEAENE